MRVITPLPRLPIVETRLLAAVVALAIALVGLLVLERTIEPALPNVLPANTVQPAATSMAAPVASVEPPAAPVQNIQPSAAPQPTAAPTAAAPQAAPTTAPVATPRLTTPPLGSPRATIAPPQPTTNGAGAPQGSGNAGPNGPADADVGGPTTRTTEGADAPLPQKVTFPKGSMGR